ncbi:F0F1 ATP synthase subunit delta [Colwellia sp. 4_MG-2023]|jgi:F-type H+-transporting ATPase subunit delta|uniref:F0F1 ATP synthase subunit delta n=1 Tax=unclassified Colwellia TaxID=196834 RepID=UPI001C0987F2|nr:MULTISPECIES: F0F1 ATP synthase subunit delta [unclassified Colwellia]MBU2923534.1 F0F1 ATP synthase subunit delta [Colwellia sp. C2M11]MDO6486102.1 F0F1 ATP synthase subunit delta [Colwellia sp. 6_MG-2023]MDO6505938.1 F0F1 ATP synthase subunit delta [Colwellia sp. 5_MG-2023]MDO6554619.1 F0F1 ATP synthase subunit delta [Colwellia sp. 4_MG-2023]MDO6653291.1 F0F1 ATP synthase subunit delta [Colwellia sp. 3_MG-2023]
MSELTTIARPYAKAAFDFAVEAKAIDSWATQLAFAAEVAKDKTIEGYLSGGASVEQAQTLFLNVCGEQVNSEGQNFIKVMAENKRLLVLPLVLEHFLALKAEFEQEITVDVTSAVEITAEQKTTLSAALEKRLARKVKLNCNIDVNIVSGLIIKAGDTVIDGSIQGKLSRLSTTLQS